VGVFAGPDINENGLVLAIDAANPKGYDNYENLLRYSEDFSTSSWVKQNGFSITSNTAIAPDGTLTADTASRINLSAEYLYQAYGGAGTFTLSCWVRAVTGTTTFLMSSYNSTDGSQGSGTFTATTTWQRFSHTATVTTANNWYPCVPLVSGAQLYIWGAQLEKGSSVTDYYPTTGTAKNRGTTWADLSGRGNNGTLVNGVGYNGSNLGSLSFDGVDDYVNCGNPSISVGKITVSAWVKISTLNITQHIVDSSSNSWHLAVLSNNRPYLWNDSTYHQSSQVLLSNTWYMLTGVQSSTSDIYVNGVLSQSISDNRNVTTNNVNIGRWQTAPSRPFSGNIAQVSIYNRALTAEEIQQNFNATRGRFGL